jgi:hypothetical protein
MKRLAKFVLAGVIVQILIVVIVVLAGVLLEEPPAGPTNPLWEYIYIAAFYSSPGLSLFAPYASERNPHPPFSNIGLLLGIILDILVYASIVYVSAWVWRKLKAEFTKTT